MQISIMCVKKGKFKGVVTDVKKDYVAVHECEKLIQKLITILTIKCKRPSWF